MQSYFKTQMLRKNDLILTMEDIELDFDIDTEVDPAVGKGLLVEGNLDAPDEDSSLEEAVSEESRELSNGEFGSSDDEPAPKKEQPVAKPVPKIEPPKPTLVTIV